MDKLIIASSEIKDIMLAGTGFAAHPLALVTAAAVHSLLGPELLH